MKIASFDVGIKNMAYCILEVSGNVVNISKWGIMDLVSSVSNEKKTCNFIQTNGKLCKNQAKFTCQDKAYCNKHASKTNILVFKKEFKKTHIAKQPVNELQTTAQNLFLVSEKKTKGQKTQEGAKPGSHRTSHLPGTAKDRSQLDLQKRLYSAVERRL